MSNSKETNTPDVPLQATKRYFRFRIINNTAYDLNITDHKRIDGQWWRDGKANRKPITSKAGSNTEVFGMRAKPGSWWGYRGSAYWTMETHLGHADLNLKVHVPASGKNSSELKPTGIIEVEGWQPLPKNGSAFTRTITITEKGGRFLATVTESTEEEVAEEENNDFALSIDEETPDPADWLTMRDNLAEHLSFNPTDYIPEEYSLPGTSRLIARSPKFIVDQSQWEGITDPDLESLSDKKSIVDEYFFVSYFAINTNSMAVNSIAAGSELTTISSIELASTIKATLENSMEVSATLGVKAKVLTAQVASTFKLTTLNEQSSSRVERETKQTTIPPVDHDRLFVPWVFSQSLALYRKKKGDAKDPKNYKLLGISEWPQLIVNKVYNQ